MVGKKIKSEGTRVVSGRKRRKGLYKKLLNNAHKHGVSITFDERGNIKRLIIAPGNWKPMAFRVFYQDGMLYVANKAWGYDSADILIPDIND